MFELKGNANITNDSAMTLHLSFKNHRDLFGGIDRDELIKVTATPDLWKIGKKVQENVLKIIAARDRDRQNGVHPIGRRAQNQVDANWDVVFVDEYNEGLRPPPQRALDCPNITRQILQTCWIEDMNEEFDESEGKSLF